jgi:hemolysin III
VSHQIAFFVSLVSGLVLIASAPGGTPRIEVAAYAAWLSGLLVVSALLHRRDGPPSTRQALRRVDHSMIFVLIAGTYTPIVGTLLHGGLRTALLLTVWLGALAGVAFTVAWIDAPKWVAAIPYVALGWVAVIASPQLIDRIGIDGFGLIAVGGVLYTIGAVVYARKRPDPAPTVFGYHEVFHLFVLAAAAVHYAVIAAFVLPLA